MKLQAFQLLATKAATLEKYFGLTVAQLESVIDVALNGKRQFGTFAEIYLQVGQSESLAMEEGILKSSAKSRVMGAGVRVVIGDKVGYSYCDKVNVTELKKAARIARAITEFSSGQQVVPVEVQNKVVHNLYPIINSPVAVARPEKVRLLTLADEEARPRGGRVPRARLVQ